MGKYAKYARKPLPKPERPHPVWRGIGCLLMIIVPIMSFALASIIVPPIKATGRLPRDLFQHLSFPTWMMHSGLLSPIARWLAGIDNFWALVIFFILSLAALSGLFSFLYSIIYQRVGPPRYTVLDAPPSRRRGKTYKR